MTGIVEPPRPDVRSTADAASGADRSGERRSPAAPGTAIHWGTDPLPVAFPLRPRLRSARVRRPLLRFAVDLVAGGAVMLILHLFVVQVSIVKGHSMEPSLHDGDRLVVDRITYAMAEVDRFDLIVLRYPRDPSIDFVKRVVALPGEVVAIADGELFVNGEPVGMPCRVVHDHAEMAPVQVPPDAYFVLGDNRPISCDSRSFGLVPEELIRGRVRVRFWPLATATIF